MQTKKKILIFDFDGTIADTLSSLFDISNRLSKEFNYKKAQVHELGMLKNNSVMENIRHLKIPLLKVPVIIAKAKNELNKEIHSVKPIRGLKKVLRELKATGIQMGILTSNSSKNVIEFLKNHDLDIFDFISHSSRIWSKNINLNRLLKEKGYPLKNVIYIGDEIRDIKAAKKAGIAVAAVTWGYNSIEALRPLRPDFLLNKPTDLHQLCNEFLR